MKIRSFFYICLIFICACSTKDKDTPKEVVKKEFASIDASQDDLLQSGKNFYSKKLFTIANESFSSLKNVYPIGPYRELAEIKTADAFFFSKEFASAAPLYEKFAREHPASKACPYAILMAGRAYQLSYTGLGRDITPLQKSLKFYKKFVSNYPTTPYVVEARKFQEEALKELIAKQQLIAEYYEKQDFTNAAKARTRSINEKLTPELKRVLAEKQTRSQKTSIVLDRPLPSLIVPLSEKQENVTSGDLYFRGCKNGTAIFEIANLNMFNTAKSLKKALPQNGQISIKLSSDTNKSTLNTVSCFKKNDLTYYNNEIKLITEKQVAILTLEHPNRILLIENN